MHKYYTSNIFADHTFFLILKHTFEFSLKCFLRNKYYFCHIQEVYNIFYDILSFAYLFCCYLDNFICLKKVS